MRPVDESHGSTAAENPFCTRRIRPGAMPYLFAPNESAELLVDRLRQSDWQGEIIGPHGSGKSSLLAALMPALEQAGQSTLLIELHDAQRRLPIDLSRDARLAPPAIVIVDGYEQLSRWNRSRLTRFCKSRGLGLLVTAHASVGLPLVFQTAPSLALAEQIVGQLLGGSASACDAAAIHECYARHHGDLREMLFDLFSLHQRWMRK